MPNHQENRLHEQRIMVVDDDRYLLMAIDQTLSLNGYAVDTFASPVEALDQLDKKEYAAVVTDIKMPVMDGLQFLNHVKAADRELPVIMITGHGDIALAVTAIQ
ncbi:MAG TPA: response regulator, partial [Desulfoprunum sp.]|nr:response regulator [Desulfoprunum sp.]